MTLKNSKGFYKKVVGEGTELGFGEETLTRLPTLRSSECKSISSFHQGGLCRSGPLGEKQLLGQAAGRLEKLRMEKFLIRNKCFRGQSWKFRKRRKGRKSGPER